MGLPILPHGVRVQSFPVEIRAVRAAAARGQNNNNNTVHPPSNAANTVTDFAAVLPTQIVFPTQYPSAGAPSTQPGPPTTQTGTPPSQTVPSTEIVVPPIQTDVPTTQVSPARTDSQAGAMQQQGASGQQQGVAGAGNPYNFTNPNMEFFMEVTPEGITIDSLETTVVGSNQASECKYLLDLYR